MKKLYHLIFIVACLFLCSCYSNSTDTIIHESVGGDEHGYPAASASIYGSLANSASIEFNSFDDLQKALNLQNENTLYSYFSGRGIESKQIDNVQIFVNTIRMRNNIVPYLDGDKIELRNEDGFGNITLFSAEKYGLPCVFISPKVSNGDNLYITITCIPEDFLGGQEPITVSELISKMAPNYPNIDNFGSHCKNVYNTAVSLRDREVNALVYEYKNSNRNSTRFVYDNLLVEVRNDPKVWGEEWFSALSFGGFE